MDIWKEVVEILIKKQFTISTMESCTGGGIANEITNISGASAVLKESLVTYSNEAKIKYGVSSNVIDQFTVYSMETAMEMAKAVKKISNSNIAIGVTGQLGRIDPKNPVDKLNYVWYTIIINDVILVKEINVPDTERKEQKNFVIKEVAKTLIENL